MFESDKDTGNLLRYFARLEKVNTLNFHVMRTLFICLKGGSKSIIV